jgi:biopolymer transport protein ExbB
LNGWDNQPNDCASAGDSALMFRTILKSLTALSFVVLASAASAQQPAAAPAQSPAVAQTAPTQAPSATQAPAEPSNAAAASAPAASETAAQPTVSTTAQPPLEFSPWAMFLRADIIVKVVMCALAFASLVTWTVFIAKSIELASAQRKLKSALRKVDEARSLAEAQMALGKKTTVLSTFLAAAMHEGRLSAGINSDTGIKERAALSFSEISRAAARRIRFGMGVLATIGSTSPFVGLFGTVWGIMNSFINISKSQTTNLAVVAPGIAEALLATAIGLVAAIPAVIIYNHFARGTRTYLELVSRASGAAARLLSRDLDRVNSGVMHSRAAE